MSEQTYTRELLTNLIRSNLCCYHAKEINQELIERLTGQIVESINYFFEHSAYKKNFSHLAMEENKE